MSSTARSFLLRFSAGVWFAHVVRWQLPTSLWSYFPPLAVRAGKRSLSRSCLVSCPLHGCPLARASLHRQPFRLRSGSAALRLLSRAAVCKLRTGGALDVLRAVRASLSPQNVNACRRLYVERRFCFTGSRSLFVGLSRAIVAARSRQGAKPGAESFGCCGRSAWFTATTSLAVARSSPLGFIQRSPASCLPHFYRHPASVRCASV